MATDKFQNKYRIPSARWQNWDYRWAGAYFITICMKDHAMLLGNIRNKQMYLSHAGVLADVFWHEIPKHAQDVTLGAFVVMPNHVHGILILNKDGDNDMIGVDDERSIGQRRFQHPGRNSVSTIIGSYKSVVSAHAYRLALPFQWQTRFHDHVIRDAEEYQRISDYISDNVAKWEDDRYHPNYQPPTLDE